MSKQFRFDETLLTILVFDLLKVVWLHFRDFNKKPSLPFKQKPPSHLHLSEWSLLLDQGQSSSPFFREGVKIHRLSIGKVLNRWPPSPSVHLGLNMSHLAEKVKPFAFKWKLNCHFYSASVTHHHRLLQEDIILKRSKIKDKYIHQAICT